MRLRVKSKQLTKPYYMIELTKINGISVFVNPDLIRFVESTPDTLLTFIDGEKIMVRNEPEEVLKRIIEYKRLCAMPSEIKE